MTSPEQYTAYEAGNPATPPDVLAQIAENRPDLRALVAGNPSTPEQTVQYLSGLGDPGVDAALRSRPATPEAGEPAGASEAGPESSQPAEAGGAPEGEQPAGSETASGPAAPSGEPGQAPSGDYGPPPAQGAPTEQFPAPSAPSGGAPNQAQWGQQPAPPGGEQATQQWGQQDYGQQQAYGQQPGDAPTQQWGQQDYGQQQGGAPTQQWGQQDYGQQQGGQGAWYDQSQGQTGGYDPYGQPTQDPYGQQQYAQGQPGGAGPWTTDTGSGGSNAAKWLIGGLIAVVVIVAVVVAIIFFNRDDEPEPAPAPTEPTAEQPTTDGGGEDPATVDYSTSPTYGEDPTLDGLWEECESGDAAACDELYAAAPEGSGYEAYGNDCAGRVPGNSDWCVNVDPGVSGGGGGETDGGDTDGGDTGGSDGGDTGGAGGGQVVEEFSLEIPPDDRVTQEFTIDEAGTYELRATAQTPDGDSIMYLRDESGADIASNDDGGEEPNTYDPIITEDLEPGTYTIVLELYSSNAPALPVDVTVSRQ
ncbi:DVUA0089 family protein [Georgenia alba]|uniref:DVUA0089 family protein n=1 Tax=Georgenia alba TaxID=2233858 RepID=A0ABW2Q6F9_9MICO